jgi:hypothetical protein
MYNIIRIIKNVTILVNVNRIRKLSLLLATLYTYSSRDHCYNRSFCRRNTFCCIYDSFLLEGCHTSLLFLYGDDKVQLGMVDIPIQCDKYIKKKNKRSILSIIYFNRLYKLLRLNCSRRRTPSRDF